MTIPILRWQHFEVNLASCVGRWEMSNFDRAVKALNDVDEAIDHLADNEAYVTALEAAGLLMPDLPIQEVIDE